MGPALQPARLGRLAAACTAFALAALPGSNAVAGVLAHETLVDGNGADQYDASVSGDIVVFTDERLGNQDVFFVDATFVATGLATGPGLQRYAAVDGDHVVFVDDAFGSDDIYAHQLSSQVTTLVDGNASSDVFPRVSGSDVIFTSNRTGSAQLFHADLTTFIVTPQTTTASFPSIPDIDGGTFVWSGASTGSFDIWSSTLGGAPSTVVATPAIERNPAISGTVIAYVSDDDVFLYDLSDSSVLAVTSDVSEQQDPKVAGDFVAYSDDSSGNEDIYVYQVSTGHVTQITTNTSDQVLTDMDDGTVVFHDNRFGDLNVFRIDFVPLDGATSGERILAGLSGIGHPSQLGHRVSLPDMATEPLFVWQEGGGIVGHGTPALGSQPSIWEEVVVFVHEGNLYWKTFGSPTQFTSDPASDSSPVISSLTVAFKRGGNLYTAAWNVPDSEVLHGPAVDIDLDDDTLVWSEWNGSDLDVLSKNHFTGVVAPVATTAANESEPSVSAGRVAYRSDGQLEVFTLPAGPRVTLPAPNPTTQPFLWDDAVLYGDDREGDENVYVYYLSTGLEFRLTNHEANQSPTDASANWVIYDDDRMGDHVLALEFPATSICDVDLDTDVDLADLDAISLAVGQAADPTDVRDADRDGTITTADRQLCAGGPTATVPLLPWPLLAAAAAGVLLAARRVVRRR